MVMAKIKSNGNLEEEHRNLKSDDLYSGSTLFATVQADYSLSASEYMMLKSTWVSMHVWAVNILFVTLGFALSILPKFISTLMSDAGNPSVISAVTSAEWITLAGGCIIVIILWVIGCLLPNDRKEIMKSIKNHFKLSPKIRQRVGR